MDLHPNLVQSKAFSRASVGSLRLNAATLHEGQHPVIQECIKEANVIDNALDSELTTHKEDPVFEFTRCFPYSNYRKGDEDSILKLDIDWDFSGQLSLMENLLINLELIMIICSKICIKKQ